jgi:hypothetical protein
MMRCFADLQLILISVPQFKAWSASVAGTTAADLPFPMLVARWVMGPSWVTLSSGDNLLPSNSAASAGALASWVTNPLDLVRLRLQVR